MKSTIVTRDNELIEVETVLKKQIYFVAKHSKHEKALNVIAYPVLQNNLD